jgi:hypothetical protein
VSPYESEEGIAYGEGRGTATGRIKGTIVWSNYPRRRTDGRMLPNLRGLITTHDGASIFAGEQSLKATRDGKNLVGWFESDHDSYRWLNDLVCGPRPSIAVQVDMHIWSSLLPFPPAYRHHDRTVCGRLGECPGETVRETLSAWTR